MSPILHQKSGLSRGWPLSRGRNQYIYNDIDIIIGGDFNLVQDVVVDKSGGRPTTNQNAQDVLKQKQNEFDLIDIRRLMHPTSSQYTWRRRSPVIKCRLDYFLVSSQ